MTKHEKTQTPGATERQKKTEKPSENNWGETKKSNEKFSKARGVLSRAKKEHAEKQKDIRDESQKMREMYWESWEATVTSWEEKELQKTKDSQSKSESGYREAMKENYEAEMDELNNNSQDMRNEKMWEYLDSYVQDIGINTNNITDTDLKNLRETLPDAYRSAFLNPEMAVWKEFQIIRDEIIKKAEQWIKKEDYKTDAEYHDAIKKNILKIAGIQIEQEGFPNSDEYETKEKYNTAVKKYRENNPVASWWGNSWNWLSGGSEWNINYTPMTPSENFNASWTSGGENLPKGENFREWINKSWPPEWKGIANEFLEKLGNNEVNTNIPVLLARSGSNRAIFIHQGKWQEFPVIFGSSGFGDGKWQTPIKRIAKFHSVKLANSAQGDASLTWSRTVKWASLLSELWSSQGGKWWHGVDSNRLNGGHTLGCVGLDPNLAIQFAQAVQKSGNRGFGYVS